jgi:hypothetical protein
MRNPIDLVCALWCQKEVLDEISTDFLVGLRRSPRVSGPCESMIPAAGKYKLFSILQSRRANRDRQVEIVLPRLGGQGISADWSPRLGSYWCRRSQCHPEALRLFYSRSKCKMVQRCSFPQVTELTKLTFQRALSQDAFDTMLTIHHYHLHLFQSERIGRLCEELQALPAWPPPLASATQSTEAPWHRPRNKWTAPSHSQKVAR